jgi:hypothetical protein
MSQVPVMCDDKSPYTKYKVEAERGSILGDKHRPRKRLTNGIYHYQPIAAIYAVPYRYWNR